MDAVLRRPHRRLSLLALAALACSCPQGSSSPGGAPRAKLGLTSPAVVPSTGELRLGGFVTDLRLTPARLPLALMDGETPRLPGVPSILKLGDLHAVPVTGGPVKLGSGVSNAPGGLLFTSDGRWLFYLAAFDPSQQSGELFLKDLQRLEAERVKLAGKVTYFLPSPDGTRLAYVDDGLLHVGAIPDGPFRQVAGDVATCAFSPDGRAVYFRRRHGAGGGLFQSSLDEPTRPPRLLIDRVGDYAVSPDGAAVVFAARDEPGALAFSLYTAGARDLKPVKLASDVVRFELSADGAHVLRIQMASDAKEKGRPPEQLQIGELWVSRRDGSQDRLLGKRVKDFIISAGKVYFRTGFTELQAVADGVVELVGTLHVASLEGGAPVKLQTRSPNYVPSPDGKALAYTARIDSPTYARHLYLKRGEGEPVKLSEWPYQYSFSGDGKLLLFRGNGGKAQPCAREGRACPLFVVSVEAERPEPRLLAEATFNYVVSADGKRVLYTYAHTTDELFDLYLVDVETGAQKPIHGNVKPPAFFTDPEGKGAVFRVEGRGRQGVYSAAL